jgi:putative membrane protein
MRDRSNTAALRASDTIDRVMPDPPDPRVLFAAERTLLAWQRSSLALMGFGFVIERFSLFLSALRREPESPGHHLFSLLVGVALILLGAGVALASSVSYRRFVRTLPSQDVAAGYLTGLGAVINVMIAVAGIALAAYLLVSGLHPAPD